MTRLSPPVVEMKGQGQTVKMPEHPQGDLPYRLLRHAGEYGVAQLPERDSREAHDPERRDQPCGNDDRAELPVRLERVHDRAEQERRLHHRHFRADQERQGEHDAAAQVPAPLRPQIGEQRADGLRVAAPARVGHCRAVPQPSDGAPGRIRICPGKITSGLRIWSRLAS